jgi:hypothetical protein
MTDADGGTDHPPASRSAARAWLLLVVSIVNS